MFLKWTLKKEGTKKSLKKMAKHCSGIFLETGPLGTTIQIEFQVNQKCAHFNRFGVHF